MPAVIYQSLCGVNGTSRKNVALTSDGIYELGILINTIPNGTPTIPLDQIRSIRIDSITFEIKGQKQHGKMLSKVYYPLFTGPWSDAFGQLGIPCEHVGQISRNVPWAIFSYPFPVVFLPAVVFFALAIITLFFPRNGEDWLSSIGNCVGWLLLFALLWSAGSFGYVIVLARRKLPYRRG